MVQYDPDIHEILGMKVYNTGITIVVGDKLPKMIELQIQLPIISKPLNSSEGWEG